jgi:aminopeptidase YwaD
MKFGRRPRWFLAGALAAAAWLGAGLAAPPASRPAFDPARYLEHVKYLASPELRGRGTGMPELDKAADYIARQFRLIGLEPVAGGSYFQPFQVTVNARLGSNNRFEFSQEGKRHTLKPATDFIPFNFSAAGKFSGKVVFAGYGITAAEYGYDDYAGVDVKDKLVLVLRHEPQEFDEKSVFAGKVYTEHAQLFSKAVNAKMHGARGVIFVNDIGNHGGEDAELEKFERTVGPSSAGIAFVHVRAKVVEGWFEAAGKKLADIQQEIDKDLKPRSFAFADSLTAEIEVDVRRESRTVRNVAGYLAGETPEYVIVGAHYDHLGLGEQFSMAPSEAGKPHPGADDNASGTAGVIELARWFAAQPKGRRGILFLAFAGEELGLLGSSYYVNHPVLPLDRAAAMINLDMIGRVRDSKVYVGGVGTGTTFRETLESLLGEAPLKVDFSDTTGYGSSDHTSFTTREVPVLFFFSGLHADYHRPSDTWDKIDAPGTAKLLDLVARVVSRLAEGAERPQFVRVADPHRGQATALAGSSGAGYGPYFGSVPDFTEIPKGVRFADVREDSPAAKAGLRRGDILIEFDGKPIDNLYDFTYALRSKKPGDEVRVKVLRDGAPVEAQVRLERRK